MNVDDQIKLLMDAEKEIQALYCQNCHKPLKHFPGRKQKKFCCDKCRMAWWYKKRRGDFDVAEKPARGMTDRQKDYIRLRRNLGSGYQSIANELGLKKHQVRDYCRYHGLTGNASEDMLMTIWQKRRKAVSCANYCWFCGVKIKPTRKFCCDKCRYDYHNQRRSTRKAQEQKADW